MIKFAPNAQPVVVCFGQCNYKMKLWNYSPGVNYFVLTNNFKFIDKRYYTAQNFQEVRIHASTTGCYG